MRTPGDVRICVALPRGSTLCERLVGIEILPRPCRLLGLVEAIKIQHGVRVLASALVELQLDGWLVHDAGVLAEQPVAEPGFGVSEADLVGGAVDAVGRAE